MKLKSLKKHLEMLGLPVEDKVTKLNGVVVSISFDLSGCIQAAVQPLEKEGNVQSSFWIDVTRLKVLDDTPVMELPKFDIGYVAEGKKGCMNKALK